MKARKKYRIIGIEIFIEIQIVFTQLYILIQLTASEILIKKITSKRCEIDNYDLTRQLN
jgi:hypothetical protein